MHEAVFEILTSETAITNEVGQRVFAGERDSNADFPLLVFKIINAPIINNWDGMVDDIDVTYDVFVYGKTYAQTEKIIQLLKNKISGKSGTFANKQVRFVKIESLNNDDFLEDLEVYTNSLEMKVEFK